MAGPPKDQRDNKAIAVATAAMLRMRGLMGWMRPAEPLELQIVGRTLLHAALVGLGAGILGCLFFAGSELLASVLLEHLAGYEPLRAHGERVWGAMPGLERGCGCCR